MTIGPLRVFETVVKDCFLIGGGVFTIHNHYSVLFDALFHMNVKRASSYNVRTNQSIRIYVTEELNIRSESVVNIICGGSECINGILKCTVLSQGNGYI